MEKKHNFLLNLKINNQNYNHSNINIHQINHPHHSFNSFSIPFGLSIQKNPFPTNDQIKSIISSLGGKKFNKVNKRNYEEFLKDYKLSSKDLYLKEKDLYCKLFCYKESKIKLEVDENKNIKEYSNYLNNKDELINQIRKELTDLKIDTNRKKIFYKNEVNCRSKHEKKLKKEEKSKNNKLNSSYLIGGESELSDELDETKESSFSSLLNFSYDYPELSLDDSITGKLITNAIELEKTFNKFFDVKNMPNKK